MGRLTKRQLTSKERLLEWYRFDQKAKSTEHRYATAAVALFLAEADAIKSILNAPTKNDAFIMEALARIVANYTPGGAYHTAWLDRFILLIESSMKAAGHDLGAELGLDFQLANAEVELAAYRRAKTLADYVGRSTADQITSIITQARQDGNGIGYIAEQIRTTVFGVQTRERALRIARTETIGAMNEGEAVTAKANGFDQVEWLTQGDGRVRDSHHRLDGMRVTLGASFPNGCRYPGDRNGGPDEVINCRCTALYHTQEN